MNRNLSPLQFETFHDDDVHGVEAYRDGAKVGQMLLHPETHMVTNIWAEPKRQGTGTGMWNHAKEQGMNPVHSPTQTKTGGGAKWAKSVGD